MAYSELIKDFGKIRDYMRAFFVYGFKKRSQYDAKSARSYDNERRRIESWLGDHMAFRKDAGGKRVFISVDSRTIPENPLFKAFKAKSFTDNDITLHFYMLDILKSTESLTLREISDRITEDYLSCFEKELIFDESTLRKKLKEYISLGIIRAEKHGRELVYSLSCDCIDLSEFADAVDFASEQLPVGVIGSFISDKLPAGKSVLRFKHHYMLNTLDSHIMHSLLLCVHEHRMVTLLLHSRRFGDEKQFCVYPAKIYISTQTGRQYLMCFKVAREYRSYPVFIRLDSILKVTLGEVYDDHACFDNCAEYSKKHLWGVSTGKEKLEHIEMTLKVNRGEEYIIRRLEREKRCGSIEKTSRNMYKFSADVFDAEELLPWIRTFTGRIVSLKSSAPSLEKKFKEDLDAMIKLYGGDKDAVS